MQRSLYVDIPNGLRGCFAAHQALPVHTAPGGIGIYVCGIAGRLRRWLLRRDQESSGARNITEPYGASKGVEREGEQTMAGSQDIDTGYGLFDPLAIRGVTQIG